MLSSLKKHLRLGSKKMAPLTAVVIGAGQRGRGYSVYALDFPERLQIVGVIEPKKFYRESLQKVHKIPEEMCFADWDEFFKLEKCADIVFITTPDRHHKEPAVIAAKKGYHILLEKPMAVTQEDCEAIVSACKENNTVIGVGHVLHYSPQAQMIKKLIDSGIIGDVVNMQHTEPIGFWHFAHSYVRGNWRNVATSTFSLLAKSCHDIDLILYWMGDKKCKSVSSFGNLFHFKPENKPEGASSRCLDCPVEGACPYSAKKIYLDRFKMGYRSWPVSVITETPDIESVTEALRSGPYGRCVYQSDNDVVDHQVVNLQFDSGATVSFTMVAFTEKVCERQTMVYGTKGELSCSFGNHYVRRFDFNTESACRHDVNEMESADASTSRLQGHGGADFYLLDSFLEAVRTGDRSRICDIEETLKSHVVCFAAEKSRLENRVVTLT